MDIIILYTMYFIYAYMYTKQIHIILIRAMQTFSHMLDAWQEYEWAP